MPIKKKNPREYARKLTRVLGRPTGRGLHFVVWENVRGYTEVKVMDEYIKHSFPAPHYDFVYSVVKLRSADRVTPAKACALMKVSGSIGVDLLKQTAWARCGGLRKNDVTLSFVLDCIRGKAKATKAEYARRIKGDIVTHPRRFYLHKMV